MIRIWRSSTYNSLTSDNFVPYKTRKFTTLATYRNLRFKAVRKAIMPIAHPRGTYWNTHLRFFDRVVIIEFRNDIQNLHNLYTINMLTEQRLGRSSYDGSFSPVIFQIMLRWLQL